jgi:hypothetical protein
MGSCLKCLGVKPCNHVWPICKLCGKRLRKSKGWALSFNFYTAEMGPIHNSCKGGRKLAKEKVRRKEKKKIKKK